MNAQKLLEKAIQLDKNSLVDLISKFNSEIKVREGKLTNMSVGEKPIAMGRLDEMKRLRTKLVYHYNQKRG